MNDIINYIENNQKRIIHKWHHYADVYERYFRRYKGKSPIVLEIGVNYGGSLQLWRDYFGADTRIIGIDINPSCMVMKEEGYEILIGDQSDPNFWSEFKLKYPKLDILIDDGGHTFEQQIVTFECMYDHLVSDGVYLCEDVHTSYVPEFNGGYRTNNSTFIEYSKCLLDELHGFWANKENSRFETQLTHTCDSIHFHDSIVVFEKKPMKKPYDIITGPDVERQGHKPYMLPQPIISDNDLIKLPPAGSTIIK